jgi:hypothetical protein
MPITCAVRFVMRSGPLRMNAVIRERKVTRSCRQRGRRMTRGGTERDLTPPHGCTVAEASSARASSLRLHWSCPCRCGRIPSNMARRTFRCWRQTMRATTWWKRAVSHMAEQQRGAALVNGRSEIRVKAGLQRARAQGKRLGRPRKVRLNGRHSWRFGAPSGAGRGAYRSRRRLGGSTVADSCTL